MLIAQFFHQFFKGIFLLLITYCILLTVIGCASKPVHHRGMLGFSETRTMVILGDHVPAKKVGQYMMQYRGAVVWYTPSQGMMSDAVLKMRYAMATTQSMKKLVNEFKSITFTRGQWRFVIPKDVQDYFLSTLNIMASGAVTHAEGVVELLDEDNNPSLEKEVLRVFGPEFIVLYK